jgi:hypothetical protein
MKITITDATNVVITICGDKVVIVTDDSCSLEIESDSSPFEVENNELAFDSEEVRTTCSQKVWGVLMRSGDIDGKYVTLRSKSKSYYMSLNGVGKKTLEEIVDFLASKGIEMID